jgi:transcriptional/translational regulatory protein YebC/TACO1
MTKETINRAIARAGGRESGSDLIALTYEAVLPGGLSFIMYSNLSRDEHADLYRISSEAMTDKRTRTAAFIKGALSKYQGSLSSVLYQFVRKGVLIISSDQPFDTMMEHAINVGAEDLEETGDKTFKVPYLGFQRLNLRCLLSTTR